MSTPAATIPGYLVGTWDIDPVHSDISIVARHFVVSKVRGTFTQFSGEIVTGENPLDSKVSATIEAGSINTKNDDRDAHIRSADFLDAETHPQITFTSTALRAVGDDFELDGDLSVRGITKPVTLTLELGAFGADPYGGQRVGFSARTTLIRKDFNINFNGLLETGGAVVSDKLEIILDVEAVLRKS
ncbi:MAG TPA: YceI family protein [Pseudonocardiaceae bacterium]|jgi:polyisoprenoid-binding protein YceI|nr:YceI family protein [Pseudonocardiaceae bacterium]